MTHINLMNLTEEQIKSMMDHLAKEQQLRYQERRAEALLTIQKLMREFEVQVEELNKVPKVKKRSVKDAIIEIPVEPAQEDVVESPVVQAKQPVVQPSITGDLFDEKTS